MSYAFTVELGHENYAELEPIYAQHYAEMQERLAGEGLTVSPFNPRLKQYFEAWAGGWLINYVVRFDGEPVGYANMYLTNDMHNGDLIAVDDAIYVVPEHRNGTGRKLAQFIWRDLVARGVQRVSVETVTDTRAEVLWKRMGFKETAKRLTLELG